MQESAETSSDPWGPGQSPDPWAGKTPPAAAEVKEEGPAPADATAPEEEKDDKAWDGFQIGSAAPTKEDEKGPAGKKAPSGPTGPNLPRKRVTTNKVVGQVLEWRGKYGWIQPGEPVRHPKAMMRHGRIFVSKTDLVGAGLWELIPGSFIQFHVFEDEAGLGAEDCNLFNPMAKGWGKGPKGGDFKGGPKGDGKGNSKGREFGEGKGKKGDDKGDKGDKGKGRPQNGNGKDGKDGNGKDGKGKGPFSGPLLGKGLAGRGDKGRDDSGFLPGATPMQAFGKASKGGEKGKGKDKGKPKGDSKGKGGAGGDDRGKGAISHQNRGAPPAAQNIRQDERSAPRPRTGPIDGSGGATACSAGGIGAANSLIGMGYLGNGMGNSLGGGFGSLGGGFTSGTGLSGGLYTGSGLTVGLGGGQQPGGGMGAFNLPGYMDLSGGQQGMASLGLGGPAWAAFIPQAGRPYTGLAGTSVAGGFSGAFGGGAFGMLPGYTMDLTGGLRGGGQGGALTAAVAAASGSGQAGQIRNNLGGFLS